MSSLDYAKLEDVVDEWGDMYPSMTERLREELAELRRKAAAWDDLQACAESCEGIGYVRAQMYGGTLDYGVVIPDGE